MSRITLARRTATLLAAGGLGVASLVASTGSAMAAGPAPTQEFHVAVSVNGHSLSGNGTGAGVEVSATLNSDGSVRYQETDNAHHLMMTGAMHNSGGATWFDNTATGWLVITGVQTGMGPVTIKIPDTTGHFRYPMETVSTGHPLFTSESSNAMAQQMVDHLNWLPGQGQVTP